MRKLQTFLGLSFISIFIFSCIPFDPVYRAELNNKSARDIQLEIFFNRSEFEANWGNSPFIPYLKTFGLGPGVQLVKFDSINLISLFNVNKDSSFVLAEGIGSKPNYQKYEKIIIYSHDTIVLGDPAKIENAMVKIRTRTWEMNIK